MKYLKLFLYLVIYLLCLNGVFAKNHVQMIPEAKPYAIEKETQAYKKKFKKLKAVGWVEYSCIGDMDLKLKAKLDTGAATSSVNADIIKTIKRGSDRFVFYRIVNGDTKSDVIEAKVTRYTNIKPKRESASYIRRPVVMTEFKIGDQVIREEVNLSQRDHFSYPLLIGRNVLKGNFLVDVSKKYTMRMRCK